MTVALSTWLGLLVAWVVTLAAAMILLLELHFTRKRLTGIAEQRNEALCRAEQMQDAQARAVLAARHYEAEARRLLAENESLRDSLGEAWRARGRGGA